MYVSLAGSPRALLFFFLHRKNTEFLDMRGAVVNWFAKVSVSYNFANETVVAALSHFDRSVPRHCSSTRVLRRWLLSTEVSLEKS